MRKFILPMLFLGLGFGLTGCGKQGNTESMAPAKPASGPTDAEIPVVISDNVQLVQMTADDTMHYNGNRFTVHAGMPVRVELTNKGIKPATDMAHDFVLLKAGTDAMMFNLACAQAKANDYVPAGQTDKILTFTTLAGPGQTVATTFQPPPAGQYTFLCNFPGHYAAGMHGKMTVAP